MENGSRDISANWNDVKHRAWELERESDESATAPLGQLERDKDEARQMTNSERYIG